jgi:PAS domain S-box-containing protein
MKSALSVVPKDAEKRLAQMEGRYRGLLEAAPDAIVVVDTAGRIVLLNAQAEKQFGYLRDELLGQQVTTIIPEGFAERLLADALRSVEDTLAQQIGGGIELLGHRKDGSEFPMEIMLSPLESGEGMLITAAIRNISVRKAAESHLAQMERRYRALLEAAPDAMVVVNTSGEIVLLNIQAERKFGYHRDELLGQQVKTIIPEGFAERLLADALRSAEDALAQQIGTGIELIGRRKDGGEFPIEIMLSPLQSSDGMLVTTAIRDITAHKATEAHLLRLNEHLVNGNALLATANADLEMFSSSVAHDLRSPIRQISGFAKILSQDYGQQLPAEANKHLDKIAHGAKQMGCLVDDLLHLAQIGRQALAVQPTALSSIVAAAVEALLPECSDRRVEWRLGKLRTVACDRGLMKQVFVNLLSNALKYSRPRDPAVIEVGQTTLNGERVIFVRDNGVGFDMQYADKLFGVFQRLHRASEFEGTGIGLATAERIIRKHGGRMWAEALQGRGATFFFTIVPVE